MIILPAAFLLAMDYVWISSQYPMYARLVESVQGAPMRVNVHAAVAAYVILILTVVLFARPLVRESPWHPFMLGFVLYGTFNFTNLALFSNYSVRTSLLDTLWGTVLIGSACHLLEYVNRHVT